MHACKAKTIIGLKRKSIRYKVDTTCGEIETIIISYKSLEAKASRNLSILCS